MTKKDWRNKIADILHIPTLIILVSIGVFFSVIIFKIFIETVMAVLAGGIDFHYILEKIFLVLLFIEVIASIRIYFTHDYHFPLRFFFYIGITDLIRYIIINRENPKNVLFVAFGLLVMVIALIFLELKNYYLAKKSKEQMQEHLEL